MINRRQSFNSINLLVVSGYVEINWLPFMSIIHCIVCKC